jgi:integrase
MRSKHNEIRPQDGNASSPSAGDQPAIAEAVREVVHSPAAPTPNLRNPAEQPINFVGIGLHLPRQRNRPRGTVERFGTRPENWRGLYYVYAVVDGIEKRVQRRPVLGPTASMSKRAAEDKLAEIVGGELALPPERPRTLRFRDIWESFRSLKSGIWGKANAGNLQSIFQKHVLPVLGDWEISQLTLDPLQRLLNQVAQRGYRRSTLKHIRTYLKAVLEYAVDEGFINRNAARKLELPKTQKSRERFYSYAEMKRLLSVAAGRENLVFRILLFCGLRPAELLALRIEDVGPDQLRIDEAVKEKEKGANRIGETKTETSDAWVAVPPDLARDLKAWVAKHPHRHDPRAFLFPTVTGTAYRVGNFLKRVLNPIAKSAGIDDFDFRAMRSTASTLFQTHGTVKDTQGQMRHADPTTTLRYYVKVIPENQRKAVADFERSVMKKRAQRRSKAEPNR